jgi:hypothetical protein
MLKDLRCQRLAPHTTRKEKAVSSFLDTIAVFVVFAPWLLGVTVNKALERSRWRGIATCCAIIAALVAMFAFQTHVWRVNSWDFVSQTMAVTVDMAVLFPAVAYFVMIPFMAEEDEE